MIEGQIVELFSQFPCFPKLCQALNKKRADLEVDSQSEHQTSDKAGQLPGQALISYCPNMVVVIRSLNVTVPIVEGLHFCCSNALPVRSLIYFDI